MRGTSKQTNTSWIKVAWGSSRPATIGRGVHPRKWNAPSTSGSSEKPIVGLFSEAEVFCPPKHDPAVEDYRQEVRS